MTTTTKMTHREARERLYGLNIHWNLAGTARNRHEAVAQLRGGQHVIVSLDDCTTCLTCGGAQYDADQGFWACPDGTVTYR